MRGLIFAALLGATLIPPAAADAAVKKEKQVAGDWELVCGAPSPGDRGCKITMMYKAPPDGRADHIFGIFYIVENAPPMSHELCVLTITPVPAVLLAAGDLKITATKHKDENTTCFDRTDVSAATEVLRSGPAVEAILLTKIGVFYQASVSTEGIGGLLDHAEAVTSAAFAKPAKPAKK